VLEIARGLRVDMYISAPRVGVVDEAMDRWPIFSARRDDSTWLQLLYGLGFGRKINYDKYEFFFVQHQHVEGSPPLFVLFGVKRGETTGSAPNKDYFLSCETKRIAAVNVTNDLLQGLQRSEYFRLNLDKWAQISVNVILSSYNLRPNDMQSDTSKEILENNETQFCEMILKHFTQKFFEDGDDIYEYKALLTTDDAFKNRYEDLLQAKIGSDRLKQRLDDMTQALSEEAAKQIKEWEKLHGSVQQELADLRASASIGDKEKEITRLQKVERNLNTELEKTKGELGTAQGELVTAQGELATAQGELATAKGELATAKEALEQERVNITELNGKLQNKEKEIQEKIDEFAAASSTDDKIKALNNVIEEKNATISVMETKINQAQDKNLNLQKEMNGIKNENLKLQNQIREIRRQGSSMRGPDNGNLLAPNLSTTPANASTASSATEAETVAALVKTCTDNIDKAVDNEQTTEQYQEYNQNILQTLTEIIANAPLPETFQEINIALKTIPSSKDNPRRQLADAELGPDAEKLDQISYHELAATIYYQLWRLQQNHEISPEKIADLRISEQKPEAENQDKITEFLLMEDDKKEPDYTDKMNEMKLLAHFFNAYGLRQKIESNLESAVTLLHEIKQPKYSNVMKVAEHVFDTKFSSMTMEDVVAHALKRVVDNTAASEAGPRHVLTSNASYTPLPAYDTACVRDGPVMQYVPLVHANAHFSTGYMY